EGAVGRVRTAFFYELLPLESTIASADLRSRSKGRQELLYPRHCGRLEAAAGGQPIVGQVDGMLAQIARARLLTFERLDYELALVFDHSAAARSCIQPFHGLRLRPLRAYRVGHRFWFRRRSAGCKHERQH